MSRVQMIAAGNRLAGLMAEAEYAHIYDPANGQEQPSDCPYRDARQAWHDAVGAPRSGPDQMSAGEFRAVCRLLWGGDDGSWGSGARGAAVALGVRDRNVYYWGNGDKIIPEGIVRDMRRLVLDHLETPGVFFLLETLQKCGALERSVA